MEVSDVMTADCKFCRPEDDLATLARRMAEEDIGSVPVGEGEKLVGMVTDRDIVVRGLAQGGDVSALTASDVMSEPVLYCYEDQDCGEVAATMARQQVRRVPVVDRAKRLRGIVSVSDLARGGASVAVSHAEAGIAAV